ncbi:MAG: SsrA-binding protein SmpB [bacterium]
MRIILKNKKAGLNYEILDTYEAGIVLKGSEVKSLREGKGSINEAYGKVKNGEIFLVGMHISPYTPASHLGHDPKRPRKLLLHKREIIRIASKLAEKGLTLIPLKVYFNDMEKIKVELALARGRKLFDKREIIAKREAERETERALARRTKRR